MRARLSGNQTPPVDCSEHRVLRTGEPSGALLQWALDTILQLVHDRQRAIRRGELTGDENQLALHVWAEQHFAYPE